jgi:tagatose 1,6-diphosphate aldolase
MQPSISLGTRRGIAQCAAPNGTFCIMALDHRQALVKALSRYGDITGEECVRFKKQVVRALSPYSTAFLMDPVFGAGPALADGSLSGATGLLVSVEETSYAGPSHARISRLPAGWGVEKIKRMGASAVKFLVFFNPESESAEAMKELTSQIAEECKRCDIALFLEILTYDASPAGPGWSSEKRTDVILSSIEQLTALGGDILKVEFPANASDNRRVWEDACKCVSQASPIPWVLLSAGVDCDLFLEQTAVACAAGASGILAGRSVWKEALSLDGEERNSFLQAASTLRMQELFSLCTASARPYSSFFPSLALGDDWPTSYPGF